MYVKWVGGQKYPTVANTATGKCQKLDAIIQGQLQNDVGGIDWDSDDYFYCADVAASAGASGDLDSNWFIIGAKNVTDGHTALGNDDTITGACEPGTDTVFCVYGGTFPGTPPAVPSYTLPV